MGRVLAEADAPVGMGWPFDFIFTALMFAVASATMLVMKAGGENVYMRIP
jgi:hypothetical protein